MSTVGAYTTFEEAVRQAKIVIYLEGGRTKALEGFRGAVLHNESDPYETLKVALANLVNGDLLAIKNGTYTLQSDLSITNLNRLKLVTDGAFIANKKIKVMATAIDECEAILFDGFRFYGSPTGVYVQNTTMPTFKGCLFQNCLSALELANTVQWTEQLRLEATIFRDCKAGITFKAPSGTGTGSYANSRLDQVGFDNRGNVGSAWSHVVVENGAYADEGLWSNIRLWCHEDNGKCFAIGKAGVGGGSMFRTVLHKPVFESFVSSPSALYGISLDHADSTPLPRRGELAGKRHLHQEHQQSP